MTAQFRRVVLARPGSASTMVEATWTMQVRRLSCASSGVCLLDDASGRQEPEAGRPVRVQVGGTTRRSLRAGLAGWNHGELDDAPRRLVRWGDRDDRGRLFHGGSRRRTGRKESAIERALLRSCTRCDRASSELRAGPGEMHGLTGNLTCCCSRLLIRGVGRDWTIT